MSEDLLLKAGTIEITTKIARFGNISYQTANIGSVAVYAVRKINPIAAIMVIGGLALGLFGANLKGQQADQAPIFFAIAATLVIAGFIVQSLWPKREFTFVLKTSSNDVQKIVSQDGEHLDAIQRAVEAAFIERA
jgi:hypothetical protein